MQFNRRRMVALGISIALVAIGLWAGNEYWLKPMKIGHKMTIIEYKNWSRELRASAGYYETPSPADAKLGLDSRRILDWVDWFDNRARILESTRWFRPEEESRIYRDFRRKNPELSRWDEAVGRIW